MSDLAGLKFENSELRRALRHIVRSGDYYSKTRAEWALAGKFGDTLRQPWELRQRDIKIATLTKESENLTEALAHVLAILGNVRDGTLTAERGWNYVNSELRLTKIEAGE